MKTSFSVHELAKLSGVSVRTLHHYDDLGLLKPKREQNNYRSYSKADLNRLQQILLYREVGMSLSVIAQVLDSEGYDEREALLNHLASLSEQKVRIEKLIENVEKTLSEKEGKFVMNDKEKFEGFKKKLIEDNESKFGTEARSKFGEKSVDASNSKLMGLTKAQYEKSQAVEAQMNELLIKAMAQGDPASDEAQQACDLHREWLCFFWGDDTYSKPAHRELGEGYVADERFSAYYDAVAPGMAVFLRDALKVYTAD